MYNICFISWLVSAYFKWFIFHWFWLTSSLMQLFHSFVSRSKVYVNKLQVWNLFDRSWFQPLIWPRSTNSAPLFSLWCIPARTTKHQHVSMFLPALPYMCSDHRLLLHTSEVLPTVAMVMLSLHSCGLLCQLQGNILSISSTDVLRPIPQ